MLTITRINIYVSLLIFLTITPFVKAYTSAELMSYKPPEENECIANFDYYLDVAIDKPNLFQFINLSVGNIAYVVWDFGDGTTSDQFDPGHEFPEAGNYSVCLTIYCADSSGLVCCSDTICKLLTVNYNIGGHVFASNYPIDRGIVWLYKIEQDIVPYDTVTFDTLGYYFFYQVPEGEYLIKTNALYNSPYYNSYFPTYYGDQILWSSAEKIYVNNNNWEYDIHLEPINIQATGKGSIQGNALHFQTGFPLPNIEIMLTDLSHSPIKYALSNQNGVFNLSNIEFGTYYLIAEITGYYCNSLMITIDDNNTHIFNLDYFINFNTTVGNSDHSLSQNNHVNLLIYPNPAHKELNIEFDVPTTAIDSDRYKVLIWDINRNLVNEVNLSTLDTNPKLDVSAYPNGIYSIVLQNDKQILNTSKFVVIQ